MGRYFIVPWISRVDDTSIVGWCSMEARIKQRLKSQGAIQGRLVLRRVLQEYIDRGCVHCTGDGRAVGGLI